MPKAGEIGPKSVFFADKQMLVVGALARKSIRIPLDGGVVTVDPGGEKPRKQTWVATDPQDSAHVKKQRLGRREFPQADLLGSGKVGPQRRFRPCYFAPPGHSVSGRWRKLMEERA